MEPDLMVEIGTSPEDGELVADRLWQAGATAVELRPSADGRTTVAASFPTAAAARQVAGELGDLGAAVVEADPGWRDAWREFAQPVEVGETLLVAPAWRDVPLRAGSKRPGGTGSEVPAGSPRRVVRIDPGRSFGSGSHPSTRLILAALEARPPRSDDSALDVGCGSGILAVAAALLGAGEVVAIDIEPAAIETTRANAAANGVAGTVRASTTPLAEVTGTFDLVMVNVTAGVHAELGPAVTGRTGPGSRILVAGLLPGQWRHVAGAYEGAEVTWSEELDGWQGFELRTPS